VLSGSLPASERALGTESTAPWPLVLWMEALILVAAGAVWAWNRWGRVQTWIVFFPVTAVVGFFITDQVARLLPNLM
jgi:hypothetical protein